MIETATEGLMVTEEVEDAIYWDMAQEECATLLAGIPELIAFIDREYRYRATSQGYALFWGRSRYQIIGKSVQALHGKANFTEHLQPCLIQALSGEAVTHQLWEQNAEGRKRYLEYHFTPYPQGSTTPLGVVAAARDITELTLAQAAQALERKLLQQMIDALPDFIFVKDLEGVYQRCNRAFETFLERPEAQIVGRTDRELMSVRSASYILEQDHRVLAEGKACRIDEWVAYNDGRKRLLDMYKLPVRDAEGRVEGLIGIGRDVTEERQLAERMQQAARVFETTADCCFILDPQGCVESANPAADRTFGPPGQPLQGISLAHLVNDRQGQPIDLAALLNRGAWRGELQGRARRGDPRPYIGTLNAVYDTRQQVTSYVLTLTDISEQKRVERELTHHAYKDPLTGLPNRLLMRERLVHAIQRAEREGQQIGLLFIDLDGFKAINDHCGHELGDALLQKVGERLSRLTRKADTVSRLGGDEFLILVDALPDGSGAEVIAQKLLAGLETPFRLGDRAFSLSASIGISLYPTDGRKIEELVHNADLAMYRAKRGGRNRYCYYQRQ